MPTELIGEVGTEGAEREWIVAECKLAIKHLKKVCGEPPKEMHLEIQWQEHELGNYPMIVLSWEDAMRGAPSDYIARCESALTAYEYGEEPPRWSLPALDEDQDEDEDSDPPDPDMPPDPRPGASFFEVQQYLSSLIEYTLGASGRARGEPRLVDSDEYRTDKPKK
jgi:hypothetical protein